VFSLLLSCTTTVALLVSMSVFYVFILLTIDMMIYHVLKNVVIVRVDLIYQVLS